MQEDVESEEEGGGVFMDLSNMKETRDLEVCNHDNKTLVELHIVNLYSRIMCMY